MFLLLLSSFSAAYRTDTGTDQKLPWFQLQPGEFPPEGSAHEIGGELIALDHINRTGTLRQDRTDAISRAHWDEPLPFTLLPFGSIAYHGAPAELRDIPIGTHLHGEFYWEDKAGHDGKGAFTKVIRLEDDFSYSQREKRVWHVDKVDLEKNTLTVTGTSVDGTNPDPKPTAFALTPATRVWKGRAIGSLSDLAAGQALIVNLTQCTLKGPGRCTDIWIDDESRKLASAQQVEIHRQFEHEHGLPCWVDAVDNENSIVTVTLFAGFDPKLAEDFVADEPISHAVANDALRSYDQGSDRVAATVLGKESIPAGPGNSGVRIKFKVSNLLEGDRPKRILRIFATKWKPDDIPKEERFYP
jgi:hypothetical protein